MIYNNLNQLNRALDIYNIPDNISFMKQLQSIRYLYNAHDKYRHLPKKEDLKNRIHNLAVEIYAAHTNRQNEQVLHELMDTALEMGVSLPVAEEQRELFRQYNVPVKDVFSLKTITQDRQNVHHTLINKNIKELVQKITTEYPPHEGLWGFIQPELERHAKWVQTNRQSLNFIGKNPTLKQPALSIFIYISQQTAELREQLFQRLNEELNDMRGTCTTGHLSRLINVIQGLTTEYKLEIDPEKEIKKYVYDALTKLLRDAPEHIQEGVVDCTDAYKEYMLAHVTKIEAHLGKVNSRQIRKYVDDYLYGKT